MQKSESGSTLLLVLLSTNALLETVSHPSAMPLHLGTLNNPDVNVHSHIKYTVECSIAGTLHCILSVDSVYVIYSSQKEPVWKHNWLQHNFSAIALRRRWGVDPYYINGCWESKWISQPCNGEELQAHLAWCWAPATRCCMFSSPINLNWVESPYFPLFSSC